MHAFLIDCGEPCAQLNGKFALLCLRDKWDFISLGCEEKPQELFRLRQRPLKSCLSPQAAPIMACWIALQVPVLRIPGGNGFAQE
jgi:hypothetical protein